MIFNLVLGDKQMARPLATGMEYFPLNTTLDDKFLLIEAKYGLEGFAIIIKLLQKIYKDHGYFYPWTEREQLLFSKGVNVDINRVNAIINDAVEYELFEKTTFKQFLVLTSRGIQNRYFSASKRRKTYTIYTNILLIDPVLNADAKIDKRVYVNINSVNVCNNPPSSVQNACNGTEIGKRKEEIGNMKEETGNRKEETHTFSKISDPYPNSESLLKSDSFNDDESFDNEPIPFQEPKKTDIPEQALILSKLMVSLHKETWDKGYAVSNSQIQEWAKDIEKLNRLDKRSWDEIEAVIRFVKTMPVSNGFTWATNIMSGSKLREKFPTLFVQSNQLKIPKTDDVPLAGNLRTVNSSIFLPDVLEAWREVPGAPSPGDLWRFSNRYGREVLHLTEGIDGADYVTAIKNYGSVRSMQNTWWNSNPDIMTWTRKHLDRFLPGNYNQKDYEKEPEPETWDTFFAKQEAAQ
jgi:hypothetical protein